MLNIKLLSKQSKQSIFRIFTSFVLIIDKIMVILCLVRLNCSETESKCREYEKDRCHYQKSIKIFEIVFSNAFRSPRTVMIISKYAYITVHTMKAFIRNMKLTSSTESKLLICYDVLPTTAFYYSVNGLAMPGSTIETNK